MYVYCPIASSGVTCAAISWSIFVLVLYRPNVKVLLCLMLFDRFCFMQIGRDTPYSGAYIRWSFIPGAQIALRLDWKLALMISFQVPRSFRSVFCTYMCVGLCLCYLSGLNQASTYGSRRKFSAILNFEIPLLFFPVEESRYKRPMYFF